MTLASDLKFSFKVKMLPPLQSYSDMVLDMLSAFLTSAPLNLKILCFSSPIIKVFVPYFRENRLIFVFYKQRGGAGLN